MPVCIKPCPFKRNDKTVHFTQGDLFLCNVREKFRFPVIDRRQVTTAIGSTKVVDTRASCSSSDDAAKSCPDAYGGKLIDSRRRFVSSGGLRCVCSSFSVCIHCSLSDCGRIAVVRRRSIEIRRMRTPYNVRCCLLADQYQSIEAYINWTAYIATVIVFSRC